MTDVLRDLRDYANQLSDDFDIGAMTLQVCDRSSDVPRAAQLLNIRVPDDAPWTYQSRQIFAEDPFTNVELNEAADLAGSDAPILPSDERIRRQRAQCGTYWGFIDHFGLRVECVSTRRLRRGVCTVVGFLRDVRRDYAHPLPAQPLARAATMLHNMMGAELLRGTVQSNAGLIGFQQVLEPVDRRATPPPSDLLSRREREVATLVARGQQTKQVAFSLGLSEHTVENHLRRIYGKLGIHNRAALAHLMG